MSKNLEESGDNIIVTELFRVCVCVCVCVCVHVCMCVFVGSCLATKVFIGNLPATGRGWVIIKQASDEQRSTTNKSVNWSALNHASCATPINVMYLLCVCVCVCVCVW